MGKYTLIILLIVGILLFSFAIYEFTKKNLPSPSYSGSLYSAKGADSILENNSDINDSKESNKVKNKTSTTNSESSGSGDSASASDTGNPESENDSLIDYIKLPDDINTSECGVYYEQYKVCSGYCSKGNCISENRSCYCKK